MKEEELNQLRIQNALSDMRKMYAKHSARVATTTLEEYKLLKESVARVNKAKQRIIKIDNLLN